MRIAMFGHKRIPSREGGAEIVVEELSTRMAALGHEVICYQRSGHHVCGSQYDAQRLPEYRDVKLRVVPTLDQKGLAAVTSGFFAALCAALGRAQVVHIHAEGPAFFCFLPRLTGKRVVVTVHGLDWQREKWHNGLGAWFIRCGERMAVRFADEIIVLSRRMQRYFRETYGRETVWIPNGVNRPDTVPAEQIRRQFGLEKDGYLLFAGRLVPEKGLHHLIAAFGETKTGKKLVIAGGASDTDAYAAQLKELAARDERVVCTGFVQGRILEELYSNAYAFVLPSTVEGMPLALLEAMSYGNCCVVSDIPECTEVVQDAGMVFAGGDTAALRGCLQTLCDEPELVAKYRQAARENSCTKPDWDEVVQRTLERYQ